MIFRRSIRVLLMGWFVYVCLTVSTLTVIMIIILILMLILIRTSRMCNNKCRTIWVCRTIVKSMIVMKYVWKINTKGYWKSMVWKLMRTSSLLRLFKIMKIILKRSFTRVKRFRWWCSRLRNWMNRISRWKIRLDNWKEIFSRSKCCGTKRLKS